MNHPHEAAKCPSHGFHFEAIVIGLQCIIMNCRSDHF